MPFHIEEPKPTSDRTGALRAALGHVIAARTLALPGSEQENHLNNAITDLVHCLGIAEANAPYEAWGRYKAAVERQRAEHEASLARQSLNVNGSSFEIGDAS